MQKRSELYGCAMDSGLKYLPDFVIQAGLPAVALWQAGLPAVALWQAGGKSRFLPERAGAGAGQAW